MGATQNFHLPLPDAVYRQLRKEADRRRVPATTLAREAVEGWLEKIHREAVHQEIAEYAKQHAGSKSDLDEPLELATLEIPKESGSAKVRRKAGKR